MNQQHEHHNHSIASTADAEILSLAADHLMMVHGVVFILYTCPDVTQL